MYINVNPFDSDVAELEQSDIIGLELDYYKDELEPLYKALKPLYDE